MLCPNHHAELHAGFISESVLLKIVQKRILKFQDKIKEIVDE